MAKFCENCGNPIDTGAVFCGNCGARINTAPAENVAKNQSAQSPVQQVKYAQPTKQQESYYNPSVYTQQHKPKQKTGGWIALIVGAFIALILIVTAIIVFVVLPIFKSQFKSDEPTDSVELSVVSTEAYDALPDFEKYDMVTDIELGKIFDVITQIKNSDDIILGKGKLESFTREPISQEIVEFMHENNVDVNGYEVLRLSFVTEYSDSMLDSKNKTFKGHLTRIVSDYYNIDLFDDSAETLTDTEGEKYYRRDVISDGETKSVYFWLNESAELDNGKLYYHDDRTFLVPSGYDGIVCGYRDVRYNETHIYENYNESHYQLFRLIGGDAPIPTQAPTEKPKQKSNEKTAQASQSTKDKLPYSDLGNPKETDFIWIADAQSGGLSGSMLSKDKFIGKWKAELIFDGVFRLATITIAKDGTVTLSPYKINTGNGWQDDTSEGTHTLNGQFDYGGAGNIIATGSYGNLDLYQFIESDGTQYGLGKLTLPSGETENVYLIRE